MAAMAQPKLQKEEYYLGAQAGVMASRVLFTPTVEQPIKQSPLGPTGGLVFRYIGHKVCGLQVELNYMQRGWAQDTLPGQTEGYRRTQHYLELPFLCHLYFGKKARGFVNLGPQLGVLLGEAGNHNEPEGFEDAWQSDKGSAVYHQYVPTERPFDWGLAGGLGFYYRTPHAGAYQLEARFNYSFGNMFSDSNMDYFGASNPINLSITLAYFWEFK